MMNRQRAFSTLELMVTVGLLVVLMALSLPALHRMQESRQGVRCLNHLRSIGSLLLIALKEQGPVFKAWRAGSGPDSGVFWNTMLVAEGYVTRQQLEQLACPSIAYASPTGSISGRHYGVNLGDPYGTHAAGTDKKGASFNINLATHPAPATTFLLGDSVTASGDPSIRIFPASGSFSAGGIHLRHNGRANLFFLDGHVEAASPRRLVELGVEKAYLKDLSILNL